MAKMKVKINNRIPTSYDLAMKGLSENPNADITNSQPLYTWDFVQYCTPRCPAFNNDTCNFKKPDKDETTKCRVMNIFIKSAADTMMQAFEKRKEVDPKALWRIGMHMMPLYSMLGRMKIEEATFNRVIYTDDKGRRKANPIYKEIRETVKQIEMTWEKIGLGGKIGMTNAIMKPGKDSIVDDDELMEDYYEKMAKGK